MNRSSGSQPYHMTKEKSRDKEEPHSKRLGLKTLLSRYLRLNLKKRDDCNAFYFVAEVFWATFLTAATSFNAAYAIRLGASDQEIGYLSSIPALFAIFLSIPVGRWLQRSKHKRNLIMGSLALYRFGFVVIALAPWVNFSSMNDGTLVIILLILFSITNRPFIIGFAPMQSKVIPPQRQAAVISTRMQIFHAVRSLSVFLLGLWLNAIIFPLNYQIMYLVTFGLSIISVILLFKIEPPEKTEEEKKQELIEKAEQLSFKDQIKKLRLLLKDNPQFLRFILNTLVMDFGMWATSPLFTIFYVKELGASDAWLGTYSALHSVCNIAGYAIWRPVVKRFGEIRMLKWTAMLRPLFPLSIALFPNLNAILFIASAWGIIIPGLGLSYQSTYLKMLPPNAREEAQSVYSTIQNTSMFLSPLLGIAIAGAIGIPTTLLIFSGARLAGSLMWMINPIDAPKFKKTQAEGVK